MSICQYLLDLKKEKNPVVSFVTSILEMRKLRYEDVKCLPKFPHFVSSLAGLRTDSLFHNFLLWTVEGIGTILPKYSFGIQSNSMDLPKCPEMVFFSLLIFHLYTIILCNNAFKIRCFIFDLLLLPSVWISPLAKSHVLFSVLF